MSARPRRSEARAPRLAPPLEILVLIYDDCDDDDDPAGGAAANDMAARTGVEPFESHFPRPTRFEVKWAMSPGGLAKAHLMSIQTPNKHKYIVLCAVS